MSLTHDADPQVQSIEPLRPARSPGLVLASRGDALTPYLFEVLARRYPIRGTINPELTRTQRAGVAAAAFRPSRQGWVEQYYKSHLGYRLRSVNAARQHRRLAVDHAPVLQVHALFEIAAAPSLLYVDCTHQQSAEGWPAWNPLRGEALSRWYRREASHYRSAEHIFAFSRWTRDSLVSAYGVAPDRVSVVGIGMNLYRLPAVATRVAPTALGGLTSSSPVVLFVGNDFSRKGGHVLLAAFRELRRRFPQARLQLVGTNPGIAAEPGVEVLGRIRDRHRMTQLYRAATVFCLPSFFDPMPLVLLEAMAYGLPIVTTASAGIPDVVTHGRHGLLVPPGDPDAVAAALLELLTDPVLAAGLGAAARERVAGNFTWEHVVDRMAPVLDGSIG